MKVRLGLTPKLTLILVVFAAVLLATVGMLSYNSGRTALREAAISELLSSALEKEAALDGWVEGRLSDITALTQSPSLQAVLQSFSSAPGSSTASAARELLARELRPQVNVKREYV